MVSVGTHTCRSIHQSPRSWSVCPPRRRCGGTSFTGSTRSPTKTTAAVGIFPSATTGTSNSTPRSTMGDSEELTALAIQQREKGLLHPCMPNYDEKLRETWGGPPMRMYPEALKEYPKMFAAQRGRVALVTGGTGGIGFYVAKLLAKCADKDPHNDAQTTQTLVALRAFQNARGAERAPRPAAESASPSSCPRGLGWRTSRRAPSRPSWRRCRKPNSLCPTSRSTWARMRRSARLARTCAR